MSFSFLGYGNLTPFMTSPKALQSPLHDGGSSRNQPSMASPGQQMGSSTPNSIVGGRDRVRRDNTLIGKHVRIIQGPMKGNLIPVPASNQNSKTILY